jgi:hypothetical protein
VPFTDDKTVFTMSEYDSSTNQTIVITAELYGENFDTNQSVWSGDLRIHSSAFNSYTKSAYFLTSYNNHLSLFEYNFTTKSFSYFSNATAGTGVNFDILYTKVLANSHDGSIYAIAPKSDSFGSDFQLSYLNTTTETFELVSKSDLTHASLFSTSAISFRSTVYNTGYDAIIQNNTLILLYRVLKEHSTTETNIGKIEYMLNTSFSSDWSKTIFKVPSGNDFYHCSFIFNASSNLFLTDSFFVVYVNKDSQYIPTVDLEELTGNAIVCLAIFGEALFSIIRPYTVGVIKRSLYLARIIAPIVSAIIFIGLGSYFLIKTLKRRKKT